MKVIKKFYYFYFWQNLTYKQNRERLKCLKNNWPFGNKIKSKRLKKQNKKKKKTKVQYQKLNFNCV